MFNLEQANKQKVSSRKTKEQSGTFLCENIYVTGKANLPIPSPIHGGGGLLLAEDNKSSYSLSSPGAVGV